MFSPPLQHLSQQAGYNKRMYTGAGKGFADPQAITTHFQLHEGESVADFGAGSGHYMKPLSDAVGKSGRVFLCEIQKNLVDALGNKAQELRLTNIRPLWSDLETAGGIKLEDGVLDAGLLSNTLFQLSDKDGALREIARVLRKGAKLFIIDWTDSFGGLGPIQGHVVRADEAKAIAERAGFTVERSFPAGDHHYGIGCRRR